MREGKFVRVAQLVELVRTGNWWRRGEWLFFACAWLRRGRFLDENVTCRRGESSASRDGSKANMIPRVMLATIELERIIRCFAVACYLLLP